MALQPFHDEELNYFKFLSLVLNKFPKALRHAFKVMWDETIGHRPGYQLWDDSTAVRNMFASSEGGTARVPTQQSYEEWDCTALFQATIFSQTFAIYHKTLNDCVVPEGSFHVSVVNSEGNMVETFALAIDQLRRLKNWIFDSTSPEMDQATFDLYIQHAKEAFRALGVETGTIDAIGSLRQSDFSTRKVRELEQQIKRESHSYIKWLENISFDIKEIKTLVTFVTVSTFVVILVLLILTAFIESQIASKDDVASLKCSKMDDWKTDQISKLAEVSDCAALTPPQCAMDSREEHTRTANDNNYYYKLRITQSELHKFDSAIKLHQHGLKITRKQYGEEHVKTADNYRHLGNVQRELGDLTSALKSHQRSLDITRKLYGEENVKTANNYLQLGITQRELGDLNSALKSHECAFHITRKLFGEEHTRTADYYHQLGINQRELGDFNSALKSHQHALNITRKLFGEEHKGTADNYHQLGINQRELGDFSSALNSHQHALNITRKLFGEEHARTSDNHHQLGINHVS